jgi:hypothetical protein
VTRRNQPYLIGLEEFGLARKDLRALRDRTFHVSASFRPPQYTRLFHLPPPRRKQAIEEWYRSVDARVRRSWEGPPPRRVGSARKPLAFEAAVTGRQLAQLLRSSHLDYVTINRIAGFRRPRPPKAEPQFFAVRAILAIQVEGQRRGMQTYEDRIVLVKAGSSEQAEKRLSRQFRDYGSPYLNDQGHMVRWHLERVVNVYDTSELTIDPAGTEVYSELRSRRMRPEYEWHPLRQRPRTRQRRD